jgi:hypothetical protein
VANVKNSGRVLAAACAAAGLLLVGCEKSVDIEAQNAGRMAAGRVLSAGEPRATDKLLDEITAGGEATVQQLMDRLTKTPSIGEYVALNTSEQDLENAIKTLQDGLALNPDAVTKSALQMQLGAAQLQLSDARSVAVRADVVSLNRQADGILSLAQEVIDLNNQAGVLEKANQPPSADASNKAKAAVADLQKALDAVQAKVRDLQSQIAAKEAQARKIYADTDAAFTAADAMKGEASIAAANKAMEDRKQAEALMAESGILAPALAQAQAEEELATVALRAAQQDATQAAAAYEAASKAVEASKEQISKLRGAAAAIVSGEGKEIGLTAQVAKFAELAGKLEPKIRSALTPADAAAASFRSAYGNYGTYISDISTLSRDRQWPTDDPLNAVIKDQRSTVLMVWSQSAAEQQAGRLCLEGAQAFGLINTVMTKAGQANVPAKVDISPDVRRTFMVEAANRYKLAVTAVELGNQRKGGDLDKIRWMGLSLAATAQQGAFLAGNQDAHTAAVSAKEEAVRINPELAGPMGWIR